MTTFVLVHGAWHGAWCWELLTPELERRGHRCLAVDLPCDDPLATFADYADVVCAALPPDRDDNVLVAHSLGGHSATLAAARGNVARLIYLCALVPEPGRSMLDQARDGDGMLDPAYLAGLGPADESGRREWVDEQIARDVIFHDCADDVARAAYRRLRPQANGLYSVPCPLTELPRLPATYVLATGDRLVGTEWSRSAARRVGAELVEIPGGHSPGLARPAELAEILDSAVPTPGRYEGRGTST
ncbi:MAG: hypothetical protein QOJ34_1446 [Pseudonocardiales bacterium]|jgi:pimeloyl-ACP methyl ester carboxylesterase|nr:hypothetical protein [Pseudonocardiales bacterium]